MIQDSHGDTRRSQASTRAATAIACALAAGRLLLCAPAAYASETPQGTYEIDVTCAAAAAAAQTEAADTADEDQRAKGAQIAQWTLVTAEAAGQRLGLQEAAVHQAVDDARHNIQGHLRQPNPAKAASERTKLGRTVIRCALLHAIEKSRGVGDQPDR